MPLNNILIIEKPDQPFKSVTVKGSGPENKKRSGERSDLFPPLVLNDTQKEQIVKAMRAMPEKQSRIANVNPTELQKFCLRAISIQIYRRWFQLEDMSTNEKQKNKLSNQLTALNKSGFIETVSKGYGDRKYKIKSTFSRDEAFLRYCMDVMENPEKPNMTLEEYKEQFSNSVTQSALDPTDIMKEVENQPPKVKKLPMPIVEQYLEDTEIATAIYKKLKLGPLIKGPVEKKMIALSTSQSMQLSALTRWDGEDENIRLERSTKIFNMKLDRPLSRNTVNAHSLYFKNTGQSLHLVQQSLVRQSHLILIKPLSGLTQISQNRQEDLSFEFIQNYVMEPEDSEKDQKNRPYKVLAKAFKKLNDTLPPIPKPGF